MAGTADSVRRLASLASEQIDWPPAEGIEATPGTLGGCPRFAGTRIALEGLHQYAAAGYDDATILEAYPALGADDLARGRAYLAAHADLFAGWRWRGLLAAADWGSAYDTGLDDLKADLRAVLARVAALEEALAPFAEAEPFFRLWAVHGTMVCAYVTVDEATDTLMEGRSITLADLQRARNALAGALVAATAPGREAGR